jgi:hypothetical protein
MVVFEVKQNIDVTLRACAMGPGYTKTHVVRWLKVDQVFACLDSAGDSVGQITLSSVTKLPVEGEAL